MRGFEVVEGYVPGSLGRVASLHGSYYHEHWGFGVFFEAKVATELSAFLTSYQAGRSAAEVSLKRYRYTGKERDEESGLSRLQGGKFEIIFRPDSP